MAAKLVPVRVVLAVNSTKENHKVRTTNIKESATVYVPPSELGLSPASWPFPPERGGAHSPAGEGLVESQFRRLEKKLSTLPTLWCKLWQLAQPLYREITVNQSKSETLQ